MNHHRHVGLVNIYVELICRAEVQMVLITETGSYGKMMIQQKIYLHGVFFIIYS